MNKSTEFTIIYEGEALAENTIDVKYLAPALLSIENIFQEANRVLNGGDDAEIKIYVRATGKGSFEIDFTAVLKLVEQLKNFLTEDWVISVINLKELILLGGGLFWLIKKLKGKKLEKKEKFKNDIYRITAENQTIDIQSKLLKLYQDTCVRKAAEGIVAPLKKDGINNLKIKDKEKIEQIISKSEADFFDVSIYDTEEIVSETNKKQEFSIVSLSFKEGNKWKLNYGNTQISVKIKDEEFLKKVYSGSISFAKGDILICNIKNIQKNTKDGLKNEYEVLKVLKHKHNSVTQMQLFKI
jgi:hypothetical protein